MPQKWGPYRTIIKTHPNATRSLPKGLLNGYSMPLEPVIGFSKLLLNLSQPSPKRDG
jgi:hypothetical protein